MADTQIHANVDGNPKLTGFTLEEYKRLNQREIVKGYFMEGQTLQPWDYGHKWSVCPMCGPMVVCGKCGNNACNAGHGTLPDGTDCTACHAAYDIQSTQYPGPLVWEDRWWRLKAYAWHYVGWFFWKTWDTMNWHLWQKRKWKDHLPQINITGVASLIESSDDGNNQRTHPLGH